MSNNSSWKKYGGIKINEQFTNINTNHLVVDFLSLKNSYIGTFRIEGDLSVTGSTSIENDLKVSGNVVIPQKINAGFLDLSYDLYVHGNTFQYNKLNLVGSTGSGSMFLLGDTSGVGMNKLNPEAILDICGSRTEILNVFSNQSKTTNILARNRLNYGITLSSDLSSSNLNFYHSDIPINSSNDYGNGAGQIKYEPSGNMTINVPNNLKILSKMIVSDRPDQLSSSISGETLTIYDTSSGIFLQDIYNKPDTYTGNALSLVTTDTSSVTFLNINTNRKKGWKWGGGVFPNDLRRNMGTMGYTDINNTYVPSEIIVSGNSLVKTRSTIGINTYSPKTENYIMDINGPVCIGHQEITLVKNVPFEIVSMSFSRQPGYTDFGIAIGSPKNLKITDPSYSCLITKDGSKSWSILDLSCSTTISVNDKFNIFCYDQYNIVISAINKYIYYSRDVGKNWYYYDIDKDTAKPTIYMNGSNIYLAYTSVVYSFTKNVISYNTTYDLSFSFTDNKKITCIHGYGNYLYAAGNFIGVYNNSIWTYFVSSYSYKSIYTLDGSCAIAVGSKIISYTTNNGINWNDNTTIDVSFNDVFIWDTFNAIAVGNAGKIYYTIDSYLTWQLLTSDKINAMGNGNNVINTSINFTSVKMLAIDSIVLSGVTSTYLCNADNSGNIGNTKMYYLYVPNLFNYSNLSPSSILDICGNMVISGDININNSGKIKSTNDTFYLLNNNVKNIYFAQDASFISIGNNSSGTIKVNDVSMNGNLMIASGNIVTTCISANLFTYASNINIGNNSSGTIKVNDVSMNGKLMIASGNIVTTCISGNLFTDASFISIGNNSSGTIKVNDVSMNGKLMIASGNIVTTCISGNLFTDASTINIGSSSTGTIKVKDISMNGNLMIASGNIVTTCISGNLFTDASFISIGNINSGTIKVNDISMNGKLMIASGNIVTTNNTGNLFTDASAIYIGGTNSTIFITGVLNNEKKTNTALTTSVVGSKQTFLNAGSINESTRYNAGLYIYGISNELTTGQSFFATSFDGKQVKFKAPLSTDVVSINISDFSTKITSNKLNNGILTLNVFRGNDDSLYTSEKITHQINVSQFDISHILLRDLSSTALTQVINTQVNINKNLSINNTFNPSDTINAALDVSGNFLHSNGWITQILPIESANKLKQTYIQGLLDISGGDLTIRNSGNIMIASGNIKVKDISMNGNLMIASGNIVTTNTSADLFTNATTINIGNINSGTIKVKDISMNGTLTIGSGNLVTTNTSANLFINTSTINIGSSSGTIKVKDISMNGTLMIESGNIVTTNNTGNLFTYATNINIGGNLDISNNISIGGSTGIIKLNTDVSMNRNLNVNGSINVIGSVTAFSFNATSDYRIKENIQQILYSLDDLKPVQYTNKLTKKEDIGLIAHELQNTIPILVNGEKDGVENQSINYIGLIGLLIKEIQDLKKRVFILEKEIIKKT